MRQEKTEKHLAEPEYQAVLPLYGLIRGLQLQIRGRPPHLFGTANRRNSEIHGFKVNLCVGHHRGSNKAVHNDRETDLLLKKMCQEEYEKTHTRQEFVQIIGKSYLGGEFVRT